MHPEQEEAILQVARGVDNLANVLSRRMGITEDDALDVVRGLDGITDAILDGDYREMLNEAVRVIHLDKPDPAMDSRESPRYMPPATTPQVFNAHVTQAIKPYMKAIMGRVAKDRDLGKPDDKTVEAVLSKIDWSKAAYDAQRMPEKPSRTSLRLFWKKVFRPMGQVIDKIPFEWIIYASIAAPVMGLMFKSVRRFGGYEAAGAPVAKAGLKYSRYQQRKANKAWHKQYGRGTKFTGGKVY